jgi:hypothetical protein
LILLIVKFSLVVIGVAEIKLRLFRIKFLMTTMMVMPPLLVRVLAIDCLLFRRACRGHGV